MSHGANFQTNLQNYMKAESISHNSVALKTGVSQKTVWSVVTGRSVPSLNTAEVVANAVGVDVRVLCGGELTPRQCGRSQRMGRMLDQMVSLTDEQLATLAGVLKAFTSTD